MIYNMNEQILELYERLPNDGTKGKVQREIATKCNRSIYAVKNQWIPNREFPEQFQSISLEILKQYN